MNVEKAKKYAIKCHRETNHTYGSGPYSDHLFAVVEVALRFIQLMPDDQKSVISILSACWAHDVIEDTRQTYNDVKKELGEEVAELVYAVTNEKGRARKDRANDKYYAGIRSTPYATFIKLCDRIANIEHAVANNHSMLSAYKKENEEFKEQLYNDVYRPMFDHIDILLLKQPA